MQDSSGADVKGLMLQLERAEWTRIYVNAVRHEIILQKRIGWRIAARAVIEIHNYPMKFTPTSKPSSLQCGNKVSSSLE